MWTGQNRSLHRSLARFSLASTYRLLVNVVNIASENVKKNCREKCMVKSVVASKKCKVNLYDSFPGKFILHLGDVTCYCGSSATGTTRYRHCSLSIILATANLLTPK